MRVPFIPIAVLVVLFGGAVGVLYFSESATVMDAPIAGRFMDVEGTETEVAIAPDGMRYALIASGDLWFVDLGNNREVRLTETIEPESAPQWTSDSERITFTRGNHTIAIDPADGRETPVLEDARHLTEFAGQIAFVRNRALWVAAPDGSEARELVPADARQDVTIRLPRYSPSGNQIVFIKTLHNLFGEVWRVALDTGEAFPVIADRGAENPSSAEWVGDDTQLVYLTDRSGGLAVWHIDLETSTLVPLTAPMMQRSLAPLGIDVHGNRIVLPRHTFDSDIATSGGSPVLGGPGLQMEPVLSADGRLIAYTIARDSISEVWIMDRASTESRFLALGTSPRFSPSGNEVVYASTGLDGNRDIWKVDTRTGFQEPLTDDQQIDDVPDWSPDGRTVIFTSGRDGTFAVWAIPSAGGRRQRLNDGGYAPRYSPDGSTIAYWHDGMIWTADADGTDASAVTDVSVPVRPVWNASGTAFFADGRIHAPDAEAEPTAMWPEFDAWDDGTWLISSLDIETTELWSLDLTFTEE